MEETTERTESGIKRSETSMTKLSEVVTKIYRSDLPDVKANMCRKILSNGKQHNLMEKAWTPREIDTDTSIQGQDRPG